MTITVFGATGFIGRHVAKRLKALDLDFDTPSRDWSPVKKNLGHVIYCIGLTSDFRQRPFDAVHAHVCALLRVLEGSACESFLYLSSTRVYKGLSAGCEDSDLMMNPGHFDDLYNISKVMGESICQAIPNAQVRVARLANVCGVDFSSDNFLLSLVRDAVFHRKVELRSDLRAEKDYIHVDDVAELLVNIALQGKERVYNVASGVNVSNAEAVDAIGQLTGCEFRVERNSIGTTFPKISVERIKAEFAFKPRPFRDFIQEIVAAYQNRTL